MVEVEAAPYDYISRYYASVRRKNRAFPDVADFWQGSLRHVSGKSVLNLGCGPMLYDNLTYFSKPPERYVGVDLNSESFAFLSEDDNPDLVEARNAAHALSTAIEVHAADIFDLSQDLGTFDVILGVGFFGTFEGPNLDRLLNHVRPMMKPEGRIVKLTWHGPERTAAETQDKLRYRYDTTAEPTPDELSKRFTDCGLSIIRDERFQCKPGTVGWREIQCAVFTQSDP